MDKISYYVPLRPFERKLTSELAHVLDQQKFEVSVGETPPFTTTFTAWKWASTVKECLNDDLGEENLHEEYGGDKNKAYRAFIHFLAHTGGDRQDLARAEDIKSANKDFLVKLGDRKISDIEVVSVDEDLDAWNTLSKVYCNFGRYWEHKDLLRNPRASFDVWELIRKFILHWQWPDNKGLVDRSLVCSPIFASIYQTVRRPPVTGTGSEGPQVQAMTDSVEKLEILKRPRETKEWPETEAKFDEDGKISDAYLEFILYGIGQTPRIEDPRLYLHFIPWPDLTSISAECLQQSGFDLEVPFMERSCIKEWTLWSPPNAGFSWNHHFHTEDEVFEYNIMNNWPFPSHYFGSQVVFAIREIEETNFVSGLQSYWDSWNDCGITQRFDEGPLLLLETLPGLRYRSRELNQDKAAALSYFRNLVEAHATNSLDVAVVREIIGLETGYTPLFEHSLRVMPEEQLRDISFENPLGVGENGAVYSSKWRKPPGHLATTKHGDKEIDVVLKEVFPRAGTSEDPLKKLLKELDATYASLGGSAVGCVQFIGLAVVLDWRWPKQIEEELKRGQKESKIRKVFLVFERATQGDVLNFLLGQLANSSFVGGWEEVANALSSIANGINSLHEHGVLHRDLHMQNILVTDRYYPNDAQYPHEYGYIITDIGEGKVLSPRKGVMGPANARSSYGAVDFRAPEVHGHIGWSTKAEVFSFGVIACKILDCKGFIPATVPDWVLAEAQEKVSRALTSSEMTTYIVPAGLKKVIDVCLSNLPEDRPSMKDTVRALDDVTGDFTSDKMDPGGKRKIKWVYWNWKESLAHGRKGTRERRSHSKDKQDMGGRGDNEEDENFEEFAKPMEID